MPRRQLGVALAVLGVVVASLAWTAKSGAAEASRAVLVVDLGNGDVRVHALSFAGEISGLALLEQAGYAPVTKSFGGLGGAVCALTIDAEIRGCPADSTCLLCDNPRFWSYSRDSTKSGSYTVSRYGPSSTVVGDGYVEAWRWGTGATPAYVSFESRFPSATTTTARPNPGTTATTDVTGLTAGSGATTTAAPTTTPSILANEVTTSTNDLVVAPTTDEKSAVEPDDRAEGAGPPVVETQDGDGKGLIAFAALIVALVLLILGVRRFRRNLVPT